MGIVGVLAATGLAACGNGSGSGSGGAGSDGAGSGRAAGLRVVTAFYPLQYATQRVLGDGGTASILTKAGVEPHDLKLTSKEVGAVSSAPLVVYLRGFQPAVDQAVSTEASGHALDVSKAADLSLTYTPIEQGQSNTAERGAVDPHFWLDPLRLAAVADAIAARLAQVDPARGASFTANAAALRGDLQALDAEFRTGLTSCADPHLVTSHNAFGYLAQRYRLRQVGITGLSPDQEPNATQLAQVTTFVRANHVRTIYYETLVSPKVADTVAAETGAKTAVLDPIEGLTDASQGTDYLQVMRANLRALRTHQSCP